MLAANLLLAVPARAADMNLRGHWVLSGPPDGVCHITA